MRGGDRAALGELVSCAAAAPTFPRPRGRGPPDCTWDVQLGSWLRADGSAWVKVRNEKRDRAREAQRVEKQAKQALISTMKAERGLLEQSRKDQSRKDRESLKHVKEERLQLKGEVREAREAEAEARDARVQEVLFDGETVYCAKHLYQLNTGDVHMKCGTCADLGWRDVRHAPPLPMIFYPTHTNSKLIRTHMPVQVHLLRGWALSALSLQQRRLHCKLRMQTRGQDQPAREPGVPS